MGNGDDRRGSAGRHDRLRGERGTRSWEKNYPGNAGDVLTVGDGTIALRGAQLAGRDGTVDLTASFNC